MHTPRINVFIRPAACALVAVVLTLAGNTAVFAQAFPTWQGSGTNWSATNNWSGGTATSYGQMQWTGGGNSTSWNDIGTVNQWRLYNNGSASYTLGGGEVRLFDFGGSVGGVLLGASSGGGGSGNMTINMNMSFRDSGDRPMFILTRGTGALTFGGNVEIAGGVNALGIGGSNSASIITFNGAISGSGKRVVIGTNSLASTLDGMAATRVVFAASNSYTGNTEISGGVLQLGAGTTNGAISESSNLYLGLGSGTHDATLVLGKTDGGQILGGSGGLQININTNGSPRRVIQSLNTSGTNTISRTITNNARLWISNAAGGTLRFEGRLVNGTGTNDVVIQSGGSNAVVQFAAGTNNLSNIFLDSGHVSFQADQSWGTGRIAMGREAASTLGANVSFTSGFTVTNNFEVRTNAGEKTILYTAGTGTLTLAGNITNSATGTTRGLGLDAAAGGTMDISGPVSGAGSITKVNAGTVTLSGNNSFTGNTVVSEGTLKLDSAVGGALAGTASVTVGDTAVLLLSRSNQVNNSAAVTLSGGTIQRDGEVNEVFGNLNLTQASFLDYGSGPVGELRFGTYTAEFLLTVSNFAIGNTLIFGSDLTSVITDTELFSFGSEISYDWDSGSSTFTITAIPEPSTYAAAAGLLGMMLWPARRRLVRDTKRILGLRAPMRDRLRRAA